VIYTEISLPPWVGLNSIKFVESISEQGVLVPDNGEYMNTKSKLIVSIVLFLVTFFVLAKNKDTVSVGSKFTGETLTLLYVSDVRRSVAFYKSLGFVHDYYYDYQKEIYVRDWSETYPPEYAEMIQEEIRVGLTTADEPEQVFGGGVRHYFLVEDAHTHFEMIDGNGIVAVPHEVEERPWMNFFTVPDPDNHQIVFGTKNQAYYDSAREQINNLDLQE
jgi:catechol 2,3-dioxygenase-like lactoylglutathione lyase family enzyme